MSGPRLRIGGEGERHATWTELFFDLVFVARLIVALAAIILGLAGAYVGAPVLVGGLVAALVAPTVFEDKRTGTNQKGATAGVSRASYQDV